MAKTSFVLKKPIRRLGICDSGVGGLTLLHGMIPLGIQEYLYVADTAHVPYGDKSPEEIISLGIKLVEFLLSKNVDAILVACNTMCAVALPTLKEKFPDFPFIEIISGPVHQAAENTKNNKIGVMATYATVASGIFTQQFASYPCVQLFEQACPQLVPLIESFPFDIPRIEHALKMYLTPLMVRSIDTLVLGCTHYPHIESHIQEVVGSQVRLVHAEQHTKAALMQLLGSSHERVAQPKVQLFVTGGSSLLFDLYDVHGGSTTESLVL